MGSGWWRRQEANQLGDEKASVSSPQETQTSQRGEPGKKMSRRIKPQHEAGMEGTTQRPDAGHPTAMPCSLSVL